MTRTEQCTAGKSRGKHATVFRFVEAFGTYRHYVGIIDMASFDCMFTGLRDPTEQLLFQLSFYESFVSSLSLKFGQMEKQCYRAGNQPCVSMHDSIRLQSAALDRQKRRTEHELVAQCRLQALVPRPEGALGQWLLDTPQCAKPHVERYLLLVQKEAKLLTDAQEKLLSFTY